MTATRALSFTAAVRVIDRIHRNTSVGGANPHPAIATRLTNLDILVISVGKLSNRRVATSMKQADFTARHLHLAILAFFRHQLRVIAS